MLALLGGLAAAATLEPCDVLVAGGSLASLAAAVAAANASLALSPAAPAAVCLLEITDWLGGQASFTGVDLRGWPWQRSRPLGTPPPPSSVSSRLSARHAAPHGVRVRARACGAGGRCRWRVTRVARSLRALQV